MKKKELLYSRDRDNWRGGREREDVYVCERESYVCMRERVVCMRKRERELCVLRERNIVCVCVFLHMIE